MIWKLAVLLTSKCAGHSDEDIYRNESKEWQSNWPQHRKVMMKDDDDEYWSQENQVHTCMQHDVVSWHVMAWDELHSWIFSKDCVNRGSDGERSYSSVFTSVVHKSIASNFQIKWKQSPKAQMFIASKVYSHQLFKWLFMIASRVSIKPKLSNICALCQSALQEFVVPSLWVEFLL